MDTQLVTPDQVNDLAIATIGKPRDPNANIRRHLAKLERARGLPPRKLESFNTVSYLSVEDAPLLAGEQLPAFLAGCVGSAQEFERDEEDHLTGWFHLTAEITVFGNRKRDTIRRRDWTAWAAIECLMQRLPRNPEHPLVSTLDLVDFENVELVDDAQRLLGQTRVVFTAKVADVLTIPRPLLDPDEDPDDPYAPPGEPVTAREVGVTVDKAPIA